MESGKANILVLDEEPDILEIVGYNLRSEGYEVKTALSGKEGIAIAMPALPLKRRLRSENGSQR